MAPPGVSWYPAPYTVPDADPPPDPAATIVSITHHAPEWLCAVPGVTYRWTLRLSNGANVERSWTPDTGTLIGGSAEVWYWDSDPVYGPHPLQFATHPHKVLNDGSYCPLQPVSGTSTTPGLLPPSGYTIVLMVTHLYWVRSSTGTIDGVNLFYELFYALGSMSMQEQRVLYETVLKLEQPDWPTEPSEAGYYLKEFLLSTQPRWSCPGDRYCRRA